MKTLIVFNKPVIIPDDNKEKLVIYGFLADQDKWERCAYKRDYTNYIFVVSELFKEGIVSHTGYDFKKDGVPFFYADPTWKEYEEKVRKNDLLQYAVVDEAVEIDDDQLEDLLTSKEKWSEIIGKGGGWYGFNNHPNRVFPCPNPHQ